MVSAMALSAALLVVVAIAVPDVVAKATSPAPSPETTTSQAPAPSPETTTSQAQSLDNEYAKAVNDANAAMGKLDNAVQDLRDTRDNRTRMDELQKSFLGNLSSVRQAERDANAKLRGLRKEATTAARAIKPAARRVKHASGPEVGEREAEEAYEYSARMSDDMADRSGNLQDEGEHCAQDIYQTLAHRIEQAQPRIAEQTYLAESPAPRFAPIVLVSIVFAAVTLLAATVRTFVRRQERKAIDAGLPNQGAYAPLLLD